MLAGQPRSFSLELLPANFQLIHEFLILIVFSPGVGEA